MLPAVCCCVYTAVASLQCMKFKDTLSQTGLLLVFVLMLLLVSLVSVVYEWNHFSLGRGALRRMWFFSSSPTVNAVLLNNY